MSELEQVITWLRTYEGHDILKDWHVDYTDQVPSCGAVFPQGLQEIERRTYITGAVCVTNQSNFGLYFTFAKSAGDDEGAKINVDWVNDFQHWVQEQSTHGLAPNFGDAEEVCHRPRPERCAVRSGGRRHGDLYGRAEPALHKNL